MIANGGECNDAVLRRSEGFDFNGYLASIRRWILGPSRHRRLVGIRAVAAVTKWEVQITGDLADLEYLAVHCKSPAPVITRRDDGTYRLYHQDLDAIDASSCFAVFECARNVTARLSGLLRYVRESAFPQLWVNTLYSRNENGEESGITVLEAGGV
jgi:hypothetical protein